MLSREVMGLFSLGVVWLTALLVAGAAWQDLRDVLRLLRRARRAWSGKVESTLHASEFASWSVAQRGRALDGDAEVIAFQDRVLSSRVSGGTLRVGDGSGARSLRVEGPGEVWVSAAAREAAGMRETSGASFDEAYGAAARAAGFERTVRVTLGVGDEVFVLGELSGDSVVGGDAGLVVASFDPFPVLARQAAEIVLFVAAELAACAAATAVALAPPHFGRTSVLGAVLCLAFFLGVTPLAVALRERVRRPSEAYLRGTLARRDLSLS